MISEKLEKLVAAKKKIKEALVAKGMSADTTYENYANAIENIQGGEGGGSDVSIEDIINNGMAAYTDKIDPDKITLIPAYAFYENEEITEANYKNCITISDHAFNNCKNLYNASFPACTTTGVSVFEQCYSITSAYFPECTVIGERMFYYCPDLSIAYFPKCTFIGSTAFANCSKLESACFPLVSSTGSWIFSGCNRMSIAIFPKLTLAYKYCFRGCSFLETVYVPVASSADTYCFNSCTNLRSLYWLSTGVGTLANSNVFSGATKLSIFVRASLLDQYKTKTVWTYFSSRMVGLTDEEIEAVKQDLGVE